MIDDRREAVLRALDALGREFVQGEQERARERRRALLRDFPMLADADERRTGIPRISTGRRVDNPAAGV